GPTTMDAAASARYAATDLGSTSPKVMRMTVIAAAAMPAPRAPHTSMATAVAMVEARILTTLLPTRMVLIMRWGDSSRSSTVRARRLPCSLKCLRRNRLADRRATSEPEKNAEARTRRTSATRSSTLLGPASEPSILAFPPVRRLRSRCCGAEPRAGDCSRCSHGHNLDCGVKKPNHTITHRDPLVKWPARVRTPRCGPQGGEGAPAVDGNPTFLDD